MEPIDEALKTGDGLDDAAVAALRQKYGYNEVPLPQEHLALAYLKNFWGPLPWLMEALTVVTFVTGERVEAAIILILLLVNSGISTLQRRSTNEALKSLTAMLAVFARVRRSGAWHTLPVREVLPGDLIRVRSGDIVPADATLLDGSLSVDLSSLTGESLPKDVEKGGSLFSGSIVRRGEATACVSAIGSQTEYGKTTDLLETSHPPTHTEKIIFAVIRFFFGVNIVLAVFVVLFGIGVHAAPSDIFNFVIVLILTSVPIAFPTLFAVAQSYGALELSRKRGPGGGGVLVRRLAAVQEFATVDVLCSDKTGTLTQNRLSVARVKGYGDADEAAVLAAAASCSDEANVDSIDNAILDAARAKGVTIPERIRFTPFDSLTKRTEADVRSGDGTEHLVMGLPELVLAADVRYRAEAEADVLQLSSEGLRVVSVVTEREGVRVCVGLIGLADPILPDAPKVLDALRTLGLRVVMITGDGRATAKTIAAQLGLAGLVVTPAQIKADPSLALSASVFAEAYPEDKLTIIRALQAAGHVVAMTGDGVNDAPALHQAEVGIAVAGATDVAKRSASLILTGVGLGGVVEAVKVSRGVYARLRTWTVNKIVKSFEVSIFTTAIFAVTHAYVFSPLLAVLLLFANDFVTIAITTDAVGLVERPARWNIRQLALASALIACVPLAALAATYLVVFARGYSLESTRVIVYFALVAYGLATLYAIRAWPRAWSMAPSRTLIGSSLFSILFAVVVTQVGSLAPPVSLGIIGLILAVSVLSFFCVDVVKSTPLVRRLFVARG